MSDSDSLTALEAFAMRCVADDRVTRSRLGLGWTLDGHRTGLAESRALTRLGMRGWIEIGRHTPRGVSVTSAGRRENARWGVRSARGRERR